ncbi:hypothetical protein Dfri01_31310 [Dyadobacter frigoris]|nr:hypothetical protein Dfri01_31310 [Dyadobacter frigoris]
MPSNSSNKNNSENQLIDSIARVLSTISENKNLTEVFEEHLKKALPFSQISIALFDQESQSFKLLEVSSKRRSQPFPDVIINSEPVLKSILNSEQTITISEENTYFAAIRLISRSKIIGALFLFSDHPDVFGQRQLGFIQSVSYQIVGAVSEVAAYRQIEQKTLQANLLLSLSEDIAGIRNTEDWLHQINSRLKKTIQFSHSVIVMLSEDRKFYKSYILDPSSRSISHQDYQGATDGETQVDDGIVDLSLASEYPVVIDLSDLIKQNPPLYIQMNYQLGSRALLVVSLQTKNSTPCCLILFADRVENFDNEAVQIIKGISHHLSTAIANIIANKSIENKEQENTMLLSFSNDLAAVRSKDDLSVIVNHKLRNMRLMTKYVISVVNEDGLTHSGFLFDPIEPYTRDPEFLKIGSKKLPNADGLFDVVLASDRPVEYDVDELLNRKNVPPAAAFWKKIGLLKVIGAPLRVGNKNIGVFWLMPDQVNMRLLQGISAQLSTAIANIIANQAIEQRDLEMAFKLALTNEMAKVRDKNALLEVINAKLREQIYFTHTSVGIYNNDQRTFRIYLTDPGSLSKDHPYYKRVVNTSLPLDDGVAGKCFETKQLSLFDLEELVNEGNKVSYVLMNHQKGIKHMLFLPMINSEGFLGAFVLHSDVKNSFTEKNLALLRSVSDEMAIAFSSIIAMEELQQRDHEKSVMLELGAQMSDIQDKNDWLKVINSQLKRLFPFTHSVIGVLDEQKKAYNGFLLDPGSKSQEHPLYRQAVTMANPVGDGFYDVALQSGLPVVFDLEKYVLEKGEATPLYLRMNYDLGSRETMICALRNERRSVCCFILFADNKNSFDNYAINIINGISHHLSTAMANIMANEEIKRREKEKSILLAFSNEIASIRDKDGLSKVINRQLKSLGILKEYVISILNDDKKTCVGYLSDSDAAYTRHPAFEGFNTRHTDIADGIWDVTLYSEEPLYYNLDKLIEKGNAPDYIHFWKELGIDAVIGTSLKFAGEYIGIFWIQPEAINNYLLKSVSAQIAVAISNIIANEKIQQHLLEIQSYRQQLEEEKSYLQQEVGSGYTYDDIVGFGPEMQKVFQLLSQVSFADSTVLILGETGTGKELIARAIHNASPRKDKLMVKVNCAALPANLIESELFGHEKGSFTGATERRIGKFELANNGTLFLDEIGEMPLDLQVKLLRAIQEKEIERVGGKSTIKTNVRLIAATNRNLQQEVDERRFRSDLFYRINVFPIILPPLRDRKNDISDLATHFVKKYSKNAGKKIMSISARAMKELMAYNWPGNVRELEHLIERCVLMTLGSTIDQIGLPVKSEDLINFPQQDFIKTFEENERDYIIGVLNKCNGKIYGRGGAAEILDMNISTLNSKIRKLGIKKGKTVYKQP